MGNALSTFIADRGRHFLVMGAYVHSRLRELALGGVTVPVLTAP